LSSFAVVSRSRFNVGLGPPAHSIALPPLQQFLWAEDYPDLWVAMEKTRMYIFRGTTAEEPAVR